MVQYGIRNQLNGEKLKPIKTKLKGNTEPFIEPFPKNFQTKTRWKSFSKHSNIDRLVQLLVKEQI